MDQPTEVAPKSKVSLPGAWTPILEGQLRVDALQALAAIEADLREHPAMSPSLAIGAAGEALFFGYLNLAEPSENHAGHAIERLSYAVDALAASMQMPSLFGGFTGIAWAVEHLEGRLLDPGEDPSQDIDEALMEYLARSPWREDYDLIVGLVGYGLYALERKNRPLGRALLQRVIDRLDEIKVPLDGGFTWATAPELLPAWQREIYPAGYYNLGLAHGVPGIIALLGQASALGVEKARPLLEGAVAWLLKQRRPDGLGSCFGTAISIQKEESEDLGSRLAWCYGDLGSSVALLWAARSVGEASWETTALEIALQAARRPLEQAGDRDAGLCHGAAGNGHIFNRLYQATGEPEFLDAARAWFRKAMDYRRPGQGIGGYFAWVQPDAEFKDGWKAEPGLLEGATGIGLALLAALGPVQPEWDRMLMVAVEPKSKADL